MFKLNAISKLFPILQIGLIIFTLLSVFLILWIRSNVIAVEYRLSSLEERKKELLREKKTLIAQKATLTSFVRIGNHDSVLIFPDRKKVVYIASKPELFVKSVSYSKSK